MSNCGGGGGGIGFATPAITVGVPCLFTISLPSFSFSFSLPSFSIALFLKAYLNLNICDLSVAFDINAGVAVAPAGGVVSICVPDPSLAEQQEAA